MPSDRRRDAATAATGAGLLAAGGVMRQRAVDNTVPMVNGRRVYPRVHLSAMRKAPGRTKGLYAAGSALGLLGTAPLAVGTTRLVERKKPVGKRTRYAEDDKRPLLLEGLAGTGQALHLREQSLRTRQPAKVRGAQLGTAVGAGAAGSFAARALLRKRPGLKPALSPIAGALAAAASVPVSNKVVSRIDRRYKSTPAGVVRKNDMLAQRAAITAAGGVPLFGPVTQAAAAARYAPPGKQKQHAARQFGMGTGAGYAAGAAGAVGLASAASRSPKVAAGAQRANQGIGAVKSKLPQVKMPSAGNSRTVQRAKGAAAKVTPGVIRRNPVAAGVGFLSAKAIVGAAGGQAAITLNQRDQKKYLKAGVSKLAPAQGQTKRERHQLAQTKRKNAALSVAGGVAGVGGLTLLGASRGRFKPATKVRLKDAAMASSIAGTGIGGANALLYAGMQRKEAAAIDPVRRVAKKESLLSGQDRKTREGNIKTYGDRGPLPKTLSREQRMSAYESRYVHHGGDKSEKWKRRADAAEGARNVGLAGAALGGAGWLASRSPRVARRLATAGPKMRRAKYHSDTVAVASGTGGAAAELYGQRAEHKQRSYANSPGGVAASALRRMRANTPRSTP